MRKYNEDIYQYPVYTNRLDVEINKESFFKLYDIIVYSGRDEDSKCLAYEQLSDIPVISVSGIRARWNEEDHPFVKFFVLTKKEESDIVLESIRKATKGSPIKSNIDDLHQYNTDLQKRVLASLAINSIGKKTGRMMYNDASLLVSDDTNFGFTTRYQELVCLRIEINEYMNLTAKTTTFTHPRDVKSLKAHRGCVFQTAKFIDGKLWEGQAVKPIVLDMKKLDSYNLNELFIKKSRFRDSKNTVPYWPYDPARYMNGKLFVIQQVVDLVNEEYEGLLHIGYHGYHVMKYEELQTGKQIMKLVNDVLAGQSISFDNPFKDDGSKSLINNLKDGISTFVDGSISFPKKAKGGEMVIKLCEPEKEELPETFYTKRQERFFNETNVIQHITYSGDKKGDKVIPASVRRILIDMMVKKCLVDEKMPRELSDLIQGWEFIEYKLNQGCVRGASLKVSPEGTIQIEDIGLADFGEDFISFVESRLKFKDCEKIHGAQDYKVLIKNGNIYIIIDTDEIPMLDAKDIDASYEKARTDETEKISRVKNKDNVHRYFRGFLAFHIWKSEGLYGEEDGAYTYIAGKDPKYLQVMKGMKMDKMPRARKIFILHKENPEKIEDNIAEIIEMLKNGLGRWDMIMTFPFPFKFLYEYLDNKAEILWGIHWKEMNTKTDLF